MAENICMKFNKTEIEEMCL